MSIYYKFGCAKCKKVGGFFTQQGWGWGNADVIESFQFIMKHTNLCKNEDDKNGLDFKIFSEYDEEYDGNEEWKLDEDEDLNGYFPRMNSWDTEGEEFKDKFEKYKNYKAK